MSALSEAGASTSHIASGSRITANGSALAMPRRGASFVHSASWARVWLDPYRVFRLMPIPLDRMVGIVLHRHYA
jgi:hypothetical protein